MEPIGGINLEKGNLKRFKKFPGSGPEEGLQKFELEMNDGKIFKVILPEKHFYEILEDQGYKLSDPDDEGNIRTD